MCVSVYVCTYETTAGIDLQSLTSELFSGASEHADVGRKAFHLKSIIPKLQESFNTLEKVVV